MTMDINMYACHFDEKSSFEKFVENWFSFLIVILVLNSQVYTYVNIWKFISAAILGLSY